MFVKQLLISMAILLLVAAVSRSEIIHVPDDHETIQAGIDVADDGDTVLVAPGEYVENINFSGKAISVIGNPDDPSEVVIDGDERDCVVCFDNGEGRDSILSGFTITHGYQAWGGGIDCQENTSPTLTDLIVVDNEAISSGGGIHCTRGAAPLIDRVSILNNVAAEWGGGLTSIFDARPIIRNSRFIGNIAEDGGGLLAYNGGDFELDQVLIAGNEARNQGGGIHLYDTYLLIMNTTIVGNSAEEESGSIHFDSRDGRMVNCIIWNNDPPEIEGVGRIEATFSNIEIDHEGEGNLNEDPQFVDLDEGDYHLTADSPCIDAGDPDADLDPDGTRSDMGAFYYEQISTLIVSMEERWNIISLNLTPDADYYDPDEDRGPDVILMLEQLRLDEDTHNVILFKNAQGQFYNPNFDFNSIEYWDLAQGYKIKLAEDAEASWSGIQIQADTPILLDQGWNIVAYYPTYELDASAPDFHVLSPIIDNVLIAKDASGSFMIPEFNFSDMDPWRETQGYQVKVDEEVRLVYPALQEENDANREERSHVYSTGNNMSLLVQGLLSNQGDLLVAIDLEFNVIGHGTVNIKGQCGIAIWGDDPTTESKDGLLDDEAFSLRIGNQVLSPTVYHAGKDLTFKTDGLIVIDAELKVSNPAEYYLSSAFPNPFNSTIRINYSVPETSQLSIKMYDITGSLVDEVVNEIYQSGQHSITWNASNMPSGIYFARMESGEFTQTVKLMLMK